MSSDPWKDLASSLQRLPAAYYAQHALHVDVGSIHAPGSPAALECEEEPYAGVWGETPTRDATTDLMLPVTAALDHLSALSTLLTTSGIIYAPLTVARTVLEISVQVWYRLEPGLSPEERAIRNVNVRLKSLWEQSQVPIPGASEESKIRLVSRRRMDEIVLGARRQNLTVHGRSDGRRPPWVGAELKGTGALASECVSSESPALGRMFWRLYSATTHGQAHGLMMSLTPVASGSGAPEIPGIGVGMVELSARDAAIQCAGAPLACLAMLERLFAHLGWDETELRKAKIGLLHTWDRISQLPPVSGP
ncbi:hypothetical protein [Streptomyces sp. NPDC096351]|uniref:hypothetical protein n=1 Tax=Streptomyces sp. NPDC096351 TaxID=3366087 RepID=UPI00380A525D